MSQPNVQLTQRSVFYPSSVNSFLSNIRHLERILAISGGLIAHFRTVFFLLKTINYRGRKLPILKAKRPFFNLLLFVTETLQKTLFFTKNPSSIRLLENQSISNKTQIIGPLTVNPTTTIAHFSYILNYNFGGSRRGKTVCRF